METRTPRTAVRKSDEPRLGRALAIFGAALVASVGIGFLITAGGDDDGERLARTDRPVPNAVARRAVVAPAANRVESPRPLPVPEIVRETAPETEEVVAASPLEDSAPVTYAEAEAAFFTEDWTGAAEMFSRYAADRPENVWGHFMLGLAQRRAGDLEASEAAFLAALAIDPDHGKSLVNLGRTRLDAGRAEDALGNLEHAVAVSEESVDAWRVLGRALHSLDRVDEALAAYATALALDPEDAWSLNNSGLLLIETERFAEALPLLERACAADGGVACFHNNLGVARERTGDVIGAREAYAAALEADADAEKARISLARVQSLPEPTEVPAPSGEENLVLADGWEAEPAAEIGPEARPAATARP